MKKRIYGFTLIELLVVISIISVLMTISLVGSSVVTKRSRDAKRKSDLAKIQGALTLFYADKKTYPLPCWTPTQAFPCYYDGTQGGYERLMKGNLSTNEPGLINDKYIEGMYQDAKKDSDSTFKYRYMVSEDGLNFELSAKLENDNDGSLADDFAGTGSDPNRYEKGTDLSIVTDQIIPTWTYAFEGFTVANCLTE